MTTEEKASRYDEALERARKFATDLPNGRNDRLYHVWDLESIFPELKEGEDERIRKELISHIKDQQSSFISAPDCRDKYEEEENDKYNSWIAWLEKQGEQKQEWSEEDLISLGYLATFVDENGDSFYGKNKPNVVKWIRSFANRHPTQKQEWSEEDEKHIRSIISTIECSKVQFPNSPAVVDAYESDLVWIKSLRPQNWTKEDKERYINCLQRLGTGHPEQPETIDSKWFKEHVYPLPIWKPSDEQMEILQYLCETSSHPNEKVIPTLESLYQDLKKLREE